MFAMCSDDTVRIRVCACTVLIRVLREIFNVPVCVECAHSGQCHKPFSSIEHTHTLVKFVVRPFDVTRMKCR